MGITVVPRAKSGGEAFQEALMPFLQLMIQQQFEKQKGEREDKQREEERIDDRVEFLLSEGFEKDFDRATARATSSVTGDFTEFDKFISREFTASSPREKKLLREGGTLDDFFERNPGFQEETIAGLDKSQPILPPSTLASTATFPEKLGEFPVRAGKAVVGGALKGVKEVPDFLIDAFGGFGRALTGSQETESPSTVARRDMQKTFGAPSVPEAILSRFQSGRQKIQERGGIGGTIKDLQDVVGQSDLVQNLLKRFGVRQ